MAARIPDAVPLFLWLSLLVVVASVLAALAGASALHPGTGEVIAAQNLLAAANVRRLLVEMPRTFTGFAPLGSVLTIMIGIGIAERSGLIAAALGGLVRRAPARLLPLVVVFAGIMSSLAVDAGFLVLPPLAAAIFAAAGRHPIAGVTAAYAGVSGGFSANLFVTGLDPLLGGITETAARMLAPGYTVLPTANWFLMATLVPVLSLAGALVTTRIVEPRLGSWQPPQAFVATASDETADTRRALRLTGLAGLACVALLAWLTLPEGAVLRDPETGSLQPFFQAIVAVLMLGFAALGLVYGRAAGTIRTAIEAVQMAEKSMADMALYILVAFVAAHFLALFNWSNLGALIAISGAGLIGSLGLGALPLVVGIVLFCGLLNLLMTSASAKWALLAPVLVPMF
ncbi:MAG: AbgT family transporter, partial [Sphingomonadaceae bacterium]